VKRAKKKARLQIAPIARKDLLDIWAYIATDSTDAADKVLDRLKEAFQVLVEHPNMGIVRDELGPYIRSHSVGKYVIFYRVRELPKLSVQIARVLHGARDLTKLF
jgi:toxin ParE1/3/4